VPPEARRSHESGYRLYGFEKVEVSSQETSAAEGGSAAGTGGRIETTPGLAAKGVLTSPS